MARDHDPLRTDRALLRDVQYRTDANLAARQSIYAYQQPPLDLPRLVLELAALTGSETVADPGCGNGVYLAELTRRGHAGHLLGLDLSAGMLHAARKRAPGARLLVTDAMALPLRDEAADMVVAAHMLYHVPDQQAAVRELRRVTRSGGRVLVVLNGEDHLRELRALVTAALADIGAPAAPAALAEPVIREHVRLDGGEELLAAAFTSVARHDFIAELLPGRSPVEDYIRSMIITQELADPASLLAAVARRWPAGADDAFRITAHSGCLVCS
jgi:SAM-dependent methyltransferase